MNATKIISQFNRIYHNKVVKIIEFVVVNLIIIAGAAILYFIDPLKQSIFPRCYIYSNTGLYCPGCGMTRAAHSILHGDFLQAGRYNFLIFIFIGLFALVYLFYFTWRFFNIDIIGKFDIKVKYFIIALIIMMLYFVLRNIPYPPFSYLAP